MRKITALVALITGWAALAPSQDSAYWKQWGDGQAEVATYELTLPNHRGVAVAIFIPENLSNQTRARAMPGRGETIPVMKLNLLKDVQAGLSVWRDQLSAYATLTPVNGLPAGMLTKTMYSRQDWVGTAMGQALLQQKKVRVTAHGYLDGDEARELSIPPNAMTEDGLWFWVRGWAQPMLATGEMKAVPILTSAEPGKGMLQWTNAQLKHAPLTKKIVVEAQQIDADLFTVQFMNGAKKDFYVERGGQRRLLRWDFSNGERGQLIRSARMKYWELSGKAGEEALRKLGLLPRPARTL